MWVPTAVWQVRLRSAILVNFTLLYTLQTSEKLTVMYRGNMTTASSNTLANKNRLKLKTKCKINFRKPSIRAAVLHVWKVNCDVPRQYDYSNMTIACWLRNCMQNNSNEPTTSEQTTSNAVTGSGGTRRSRQEDHYRPASSAVIQCMRRTITAD